MDRFEVVLVAISVAGCGASGGGAADAGSGTVGGQDSGASVSQGFDAGAQSETDAGGGVVGNGNDAGGNDNSANIEASAPSDGAASGGEASLPEAGVSGGGHGNKILIYTLATGYVHASIPDTATGLANAATAAGLEPEMSADPAKFATGALSQYAGVVLVATSGAPFGSPGTTQIQTLIDFVRGGGGLVALEDANHAYTAPQYISLLGGEFNGHSALGPGTCSPVSTSPVAAMLPATFAVATDEIYYYTMVGADSQTAVNCSAYGSAPRPVAWTRTEGMGRVFYSGLGHTSAAWIDTPNNPSLLVHKHVFPALLWTIGR